jgi:hypothetical protein
MIIGQAGRRRSGERRQGLCHHYPQVMLITLFSHAWKLLLRSFVFRNPD